MFKMFGIDQLVRVSHACTTSCISCSLLLMCRLQSIAQQRRSVWHTKFSGILQVSFTMHLQMDIEFQQQPLAFTDPTSTQWTRPHRIRIPAPTHHRRTLTVIHPMLRQVPAILSSPISTTATTVRTAAANRIKWEAFHLHRDKRDVRESESQKISRQ